MHTAVKNTNTSSRPKRKCVRNTVVKSTLGRVTTKNTKRAASEREKLNTSNKRSKQTLQSDCMITGVENVIGPNRECGLNTVTTKLIRHGSSKPTLGWVQDLLVHLGFNLAALMLLT